MGAVPHRNRCAKGRGFKTTHLRVTLAWTLRNEPPPPPPPPRTGGGMVPTGLLFYAPLQRSLLRLRSFH